MPMLKRLSEPFAHLARRLPFGLGRRLSNSQAAATEQDRRRQQACERLLVSDSAQEGFSEIYAGKIWGSAESGSGPGSEVAYTQNLRDWLVRTLPSMKVRTFVDAPCGDFNWMQLVLPQVDVDHHGFDIVEPVIDSNRSKHGSDRVKFDVADLAPCEMVLIAKTDVPTRLIHEVAVPA
jgi:hypothetical protein